jgi:hypothetical protein
MMEHVECAIYRVNAEVLYLQPKVLVIDFGLHAFSESITPDFSLQGSWIQGEIEIGINHFSYKESLYNDANMPSLLYDWIVSRIERNDTPWLETHNSLGKKVLNRDEHNERWVDIQKTDGVIITAVRTIF